MSQVADSDSWSSPVPILHGIERISTFLNRQDGGNTIFASGGGKMNKLIQATDTAAKIWVSQEIVLPTSPDQPPLAFKSYTTIVRANDQGGQPAAAMELTITTDTRKPVYINGLYYLLGPEAVRVQTDNSGSLTIVEATNDITSAQFTISADGGATSINVSPMHKSFTKLASLNSEDALHSANFPSQTVAGGTLGQVDSTPLVAPSTSQDNVKAVAEAMKNLSTAYSSVKNSPTMSKSVANRRVTASSSTSVANVIDIAAGDIYRFLHLKTGWQLRLVHDVDVGWSFLVTFGAEVYQAILNTPEAVVGAVAFVFNKIETKVEELIRYVEFLFDWTDIGRTKMVMHNLANLYFKHQVARIPTARATFDRDFAAATKTIDGWANIEDWSPFGSALTMPATKSTSDPMADQTAGSQLFSHHFRNNAHNVSFKGDIPSSPEGAEELINALLTALADEGHVVSAAFGQLEKLVKEFSTLSVADIIKRIAGILADTVLSGVQVVVDTLFRVLEALADSTIHMLTVAKIHIPVISDILNAIGVPDMSFLELFSWISAVGFTVVYKLANNEAPFPDNSEVTALISAKDWTDLAALFQYQPTQTQAAGIQLTTEVKSDGHDAATTGFDKDKAIFLASHASAGSMAFIKGFLDLYELLKESPGPMALGIATTALDVFIAAAQGTANILVPWYPTPSEFLSGLGYGTTAAWTVTRILFSGPVQDLLGKGGPKLAWLKVPSDIAVSGWVDVCLIVPAFVVTVNHIVEMAGHPDDAMRAAVILDEVSNLESFIGRVVYALAASDPDPATKALLAAASTIAEAAYAGAQYAELVCYP